MLVITEQAKPPFNANDWEQLERTTEYRGFFRVDKLVLKHRLYEGGWSQPIMRELLMRQPAVAILPFDKKTQQIAMVEQFRVGATVNRSSPWCLELIAGIADMAGETMGELARREAVEEANLALGELIPITRYLPSPGGCDEVLHLFASECDLSQAGGIYGKPDEGENIRVVLLPIGQVPQLLASGMIDNAASIIALQWFLLEQAKGRFAC